MRRSESFINNTSELSKRDRIKLEVDLTNRAREQSGDNVGERTSKTALQRLKEYKDNFFGK